MALKGELLSADLSNVFQMLAMNGKRGLLTVQDRVNPVARRHFVLDGQTVTPSDPLPTKPSLALLVEMGRLTYEHYASAMQRARRFNSDPWGILKAQGTVGSDDVEAFRARVANEALLEVFLWRDIRFDLDESASGTAPPDAAPIQIDHVVMEAARRQDEWKHIVEAVGSHREVFRHAQVAGDPTALGPVDRIVFDLINGVDATPDIVAKTELPRYFVDLALANLLKAGLIARLTREELIMSGDKLVQGGHVREGIGLFHAALRTDRANVSIHRRLADAHMRTGEFARACGHLRYCSVLRLADGYQREAIALLQEAWKLLPTQFSTLERILSLLIDDAAILTKEDRANVADGRRLLQVWHDTGELERAVELASRIWQIDQSDREVLHTMARLSLRLGRVEAAVSAYDTLAERHRSERNLRGALECYRAIASLGGAYTSAYEARIADVKRELGRQASRKRRGKALQATGIAAAVVAVLYAGYSWFGDQMVRDLEARPAADVAAREALAREYDELALWFRPAPAGIGAMERAAALRGLNEKERDEQRARLDAAAAVVAAQHQAADAAVSEGLRMVKAGDLVGAAARLKQGLDSYPSPEAPAASRAARALADVERYLSQGRKLLEEARALEATDPDAAFRLRLKVLRDYELLPDCKTLKLTLRIDTVPEEARLRVAGDPEEYVAPIGIEVAGQGQVLVEAAAPGFLTRTFSRALPPEVAAWTLVLERAPRASLKLREPLAAVTPASPGHALVAARNGPLFLVDVAAGKVVANLKLESLDSQSRPPVVSGDRALAILDDGRVRLVELAGLKVVKEVRLAVLPGVQPVAIPGGWVVPSAEGRLEVLDAGGAVVRRFSIPGEGAVRGLAATGAVVCCAAGARGLLALDPRRSDPVRTVASKYAGSLCAGPDGRILVHRPQSGIASVDPATGDERTLLVHGGDAARIHRLRDDRWAAVFDGEVVGFTAAGLAGRARIEGLQSDSPCVVDPATGRLGVVVDGWCTVLDFETGACAAGFSCAPGVFPAVVGRSFVNVRGAGLATITDL
jgi:tetratricopeptide (TPR) repeat protein